MALDLRPLTLGELLDRSFSMYRRHVWLFVGMMVLPSVFAMAVAVAMQLFQGRMQTQVLQPGTPPSPDAAVPLMLGFFAAAMVGTMVYLVVYTIALGATTTAVSELYVGRTASIGGAYARVRPFIGRLLLLMLLVTLRLLGVILAAGVLMVAAVAMGAAIGPVGVVVATLLGVIMMAIVFLGGGYLMLRYSLAVPALVVEGLTARESIRRSVELVDGALWRVLVLCVCAMVVTYAGAALFQGPFLVAAMAAGFATRTAFWLQMAGVVAGTIGQAFTSPIMIVGLALQYYDARIRSEALDIDLMLATLDGPIEAQGNPVV